MLDRLRNLPRDARDTLFLLLVIAAVLAPQAGRLPLWCSLLAVGVLAAAVLIRRIIAPGASTTVTRNE